MLYPQHDMSCVLIVRQSHDGHMTATRQPQDINIPETPHTPFSYSCQPNKMSGKGGKGGKGGKAPANKRLTSRSARAGLTVGRKYMCMVIYLCDDVTTVPRWAAAPVLKGTGE